MFRNYFKTAWRSLVKNKAFSFINIAGLSLGIAACLLILQYVSFELSFDRFNKNADNIYRITNDRYQDGKLVQHGVITYSAISKAMQNDYPEIVNHTRVEPFTQQVVINGNERIGDLNALAVDNAFLSMFSYPMLAGDAMNALQEPNTVILSAALAKKLFHVSGNNCQTVIGKIITISKNTKPWKITAVCNDVPENSQLSFDFLVSYRSLYEGDNGSWKAADYDFTDSDFWHYIQLKQGTDYKALQLKFDAFSKKYFQGTKVSGSIEKFFLQPLTRVHLYSDYEYEITRTGNAAAVWGLLIVAVFIIIIAWVNYINLATAKSLERAKEVGIRKVAGASRLQVIKQFLTEALVLNLLAAAIGILLVKLLQNPFNNLIQHQLSLSYLFNTKIYGFSLVIPFIIFMLAGISASGFYPAFVLSAFKPITVLKGKYAASAKGILLRRILVTGQFAVTIILIISSLIVYRQISYVNEQKLGIDITQMLVIKPPLLTNWDSTFITKENSFKNELKQLPHVKGASVIGRTPGDELSRMFNVHRADKNLNSNVSMRNVSVDADFLNVYNIKLLAGRNFMNTDYNSNFDKIQNFLINESAVKLLGYTSNKDAIGKQIRFGAGDKDWTIIGVVNDYHQKSLRYPIEPVVLIPSYWTDNPICIKVDAENLTATINAVKSKFETFFPGNFFDYYFLDDKFNTQYSDDKLFQKVFSIFSGFAIFIACIGMLGLSLYTTAQRTKEIGIRKILGASVTSIIVLLSKDFIVLVSIAIIIASPVAYYIMHGWLQGFAYRIDIAWWMFVASGCMAILIAIVTVSFQAIKAAIAKPVKSLRTE